MRRVQLCWVCKRLVTALSPKASREIEQLRGGRAMASGRAWCGRGVGISRGGEVAGECAAPAVGLGSSTASWVPWSSL